MILAEWLAELSDRGVELWFEGKQLRFRAPKGALTPEDRARLMAHRIEVLTSLRATAATRERVVPLSYSQQSLWFLHRQAPESAAYNIAIPARILGPVDVRALGHAVQALVDGHATLRTTYRFTDSAEMQHVAGEATITLEHHLVHGLTDDDLLARVEADYGRPFDLERGPVLRASLYTLNDSDHVLLLVVHHIAADGWSLLVLFDELGRHYREAIGGAPAGIARAVHEFADYAAWQAEMLAGSEGDRLWRYWELKLASPRARLALPLDRPRPSIPSLRGASLPVAIGTETTLRLKELAQSECTTTFVVLLAAFHAFLYGVTGNEDIVVGTPAFCRDKTEWMRVVGDFVNTIPLRGCLTPKVTFRALVAQLRLTVHEALDASAFPLPLMIRRLAPEMDAGRAPLFDTLFQLQRFDAFRSLDALMTGAGDSQPVEINGMRLAPYPINQLQGQFDLALFLVERGSEMFGAFKYATDVFDDSTARRLVSEFIAVVEAVAHDPDITFSPPAPPCIQRVSRSGTLLLTSAQQRLWFLDRMGQGGSHDNVAAVVRLRGHLDTALLRTAVGDVIQRHEPLRTCVAERDGLPAVDILDDVATPIEVLDLGEVSADAATRAACDASLRFIRRPFDLSRAPLVACLIVRLGPEEHELSIRMHQVIADDESMNIFVREVGLVYEALAAGQRPALWSLPVQAVDYAAWEQMQLRSGRIASQLAYWQRELAAAPRVLELPRDRPRPPVASFRRQSLSGLGEPRLLGELKALSSRHDATLYMTLLAAWMVVLHRYSGQDELIIGSSIANRHHGGLEGAIGRFANTLAMHGNLADNPRFSDFLARLRATTLAAFDHRDLPFEVLVDSMRLERATNHAPVVQILFNLSPTPAPWAAFPGVSGQTLLRERGTARFDLVLEAVEFEGELHLDYEFATDLFDAATIARLHEHYLSLLREIVRDPDVTVRDLPLLTGADLEQLQTWNETARPLVGAACLHQRMAACAAMYPDTVAVVAGDMQLTYREFDERANRLAHLLIARGVAPGALVALCVDRTVDMPIALAAVLKTGAAYVPLDPTHPEERLRYTLGDAGVACAITLRAHAPLLADAQAPLVLLDEIDEALRAQPMTAPPVAVRAEDRAYVIYTSGSTGRPKGVEVEHRNVVAFLAAMADEPGFRADDVLLAVTTLSFDIAGLELWLPLTVGGRVVIADREDVLHGRRLMELLEAHQITVMQATPATWRLMLEAGWEGKPDLRVLCGGEALPRDLAHALADRVAELWNMYGPTETTIWSTLGRVPPKVETISIGHPIANTQVYVLEPSGQLAPIGVVGELCIGGAGVARGYHDRPELTAAQFVTLALPGKAPERVYRTGDVARVLGDGRIDLLGRRDHQVKVRGYRIELGEIESVLAVQAGVKECVVSVREERPGDQLLVGYVVEQTAGAFDADRARTGLRATLPEYMVPNRFMALAALPLTPNGKIDRKALPSPVAAVRGGGGAEAIASTPTERQVAAVWRELLQVDRVGLHDDFFDVGGHSLAATRVLARIEATLGVRLPLRDMFDAPTVAQLAEKVDAALRASEPRTMITDSTPSAATLLLARLRALDIQLSLDGEKLRVNAPKGAVTEELRAAIAANRDGLIGVLRDSDGVAGSQVIKPVSRSGRLLLSSAQQRLWFLDRIDPGRSHYNITSVIRLHGRLEPTLVKAAVAELVKRHESLRTRIGERDGAPDVVIVDDLPTPVELLDLSSRAPKEAAAAAADASVGFIRRPFDLASGPLFGCLLVRFAPDEHELSISLHHIISDGWSTNIFVREMGLIYQAFVEGRRPELPPLPVQTVDYAAWEQEQLRAGKMTRHLAYWKQELAGAPAVLELPTDRPRPPAPSSRGQRLRCLGEMDVLEDLKGLSNRHGATLYMTLLAAWMVLLHRYSGQEDIVVGSPIANRDHLELEGLIGCFVNNLVLRGNLADNPRFSDFLAKVRVTTLGAFDHRDLPFDVLVDALRPERTTSHAPIVQVLFTLHSFPTRLAPPAGLSGEPVEREQGTSRFDLTLEAVEFEGKFHLIYEFATDLFDEATIARLHQHYLSVLRAIAGDLDMRVRDLPLLTSADVERMTAWNDTERPLEGAACVHQRFEARAAETPDAVAVVAGATRLTYGELDSRANRLAHLLISRGVQPGSLVAICVDRTVDMPVALAAVLKTGAAYVPLDPTHPADRLRYTLSDAGVACAITASAFAPLLAEAQAPLVMLDEVANELADMPPTAPTVPVSAADRAYVIYTSGSTGRPKGVEVEHRNVVAFLAAMADEPGFHADDVLLAVTTLSFDIAGLEMWLPLTTGGQVVVAGRADVLDGPRLIAMLIEHRVTVMQATPATWRLMLEAGWTGKPDLRVLCGGEALPKDLAHALTDRVAELWNMYGPTETTIWSTVSCVPPAVETITIGRPIANTSIHVLEPSGQPAPIGVAGELCIGGAGVARGYHARPELTAEKFVTITLPGRAPQRVYRTGDVARLLGDGRIDFLGRRDHQVKVRGYRIELGEIESVLATQPGVKECVVAVREDRPGNQIMVGYVVQQANAAFDVDGARGALRGKLPEYMVPNRFMMLEALPLTPNGKIDRKALPAPNTAAERASSLAANAAAQALMTPGQRRVAAVWQGVLQVDHVGLHDNFFDVGGHSMLLVRLHAALEREFGMPVPLVELFQYTTVASQAGRLSSASHADGSALRRARVRAGRLIHG